MFIARYAWIDKAKKYLETNGKTYFAGGGQFHDVIRVVNKYGLIPEEAYSGRPPGEEYHDHHKLDTAMKRFVNGLLQKGKKEFNAKELQQLNDTLDHYLGRVPATFIFENRSYTPETFAQQVLHFADDYVELMSFADLPFYKKCFLDDKYNWAGDSLYNIPLGDMQMLIDTAIANGWSVSWEGDVTDAGFAFYSGYATLPAKKYQFEEERSVNYKNETTERDHMLHLVGIGKDEKGNKWYYLKNSWGQWFSKFDGYMYMSEDYFKLKTVILMVNKSALPKTLRSRLGIK
jgi:bleomycin hydrolase